MVLLALQRGWLGLVEGVRTTLDDVRNGITELCPQGVKRGSSSLILGGIMQEGGNRFVLVAPVLQHERAHRQEVREVGDGCSLSELEPVQLRCPLESGVKAGAKKGLARHMSRC